MTQSQSEDTQMGRPFAGSPYLKELALRLDRPAEPTSLDMAALRSFVADALGAAASGKAGDAVMGALEYYAQLAAFYGAFFPDGTIPSDGTSTEAPPPLDASFVKNLPDQPAVLSVLDEGVPFLHERTITSESQSRFVSVWLQSGAGVPGKPVPVPFGKSVDAEEIQGLVERGVSKEVGYRQSGAIDRAIGGPQRYAERSTHGAAVLGLAAGERDDKHLLMGVSFPPNAVRDTSGSLLPFFVLMGICYCLKRVQVLAAQLKTADPKRYSKVCVPVVFNLSYGVLAGPKDGSGILERVMECLTAIEPGDIAGVGPIKFVLPMGNGRLSQTSATLGGNKDRSVALRLAPDDKTPSYVEIWSGARQQKKPSKPGLFIKLTPPQSSEAKLCPLPKFGHFSDLSFTCGAHLRVYSALRESDKGYREMLLLAFPPTVGTDRKDVIRPGDWTVELTAQSQEPVQVYVQRDDGLYGLGSGGQQARMHHPDYTPLTPEGRLEREDDPTSTCPVTRSGTVNAFANAASVLRVGGAVGQTDVTARYSALGLSGQGRDVEGDVIVPSDLSRLTPGIPTVGLSSCSYFRVSGTSIAVPQVALTELRKLSG